MVHLPELIGQQYMVYLIGLISQFTEHSSGNSGQ